MYVFMNSHIYLCVRWLHQTARASTLPIHNLICVSRRAAQPSHVITHTSNVENQVLSLFKFHAHCARSYLAGFVNFTHQPSCSPTTKAPYFSQMHYYLYPLLNFVIKELLDLHLFVQAAFYNKIATKESSETLYTILIKNLNHRQKYSKLSKNWQKIRGKICQRTPLKFFLLI